MSSRPAILLDAKPCLWVGSWSPLCGCVGRRISFTQLPLVYDELRKLAAAKMAQENPGQDPGAGEAAVGIGPG
jgi:hypothetical protein